MHASECEERLEDERHFGRSLKKFITDENLIIVRSHHNRLCEKDSSDLVSHHRHREGIEIHDVLMTSWFISVAIAVYSEIELFASKDKALIKRRQQHVLSTPELSHRNSQQPVIASCVTSHD